MEEFEGLEIKEEDLENLSAEELVDLKVELEDLIAKCDELIEMADESLNS